MPDEAFDLGVVLDVLTQPTVPTAGEYEAHALVPRCGTGAQLLEREDLRAGHRPREALDEGEARARPWSRIA